MSALAALMRAAQVALALAGVVTAGCAGLKHAQPQVPAPPAAATAVVVEQPPAAPAVVASPPSVTAPAVVAEPTPPTPTPTPAARPAVARASPAAPTVVAKVAPPTPPSIVLAPPVPVPSAKAAPKPARAPVAAPPAPAPLNLKSLEARLRQTRAVGVLTKLALKNQVDDLVEKFRAYHRRQARTTLAELRRNYDMLVLKVLSLLQDSDPPLARDIVQSRAAIWSILEDPRKFTEANLMAGAAP